MIAYCFICQVWRTTEHCACHCKHCGACVGCCRCKQLLADRAAKQADKKAEKKTERKNTRHKPPTQAAAQEHEDAFYDDMPWG